MLPPDPIPETLRQRLAAGFASLLGGTSRAVSKLLRGVTRPQEVPTDLIDQGDWDRRLDRHVSAPLGAVIDWRLTDLAIGRAIDDTDLTALSRLVLTDHLNGLSLYPDRYTQEVRDILDQGLAEGWGADRIRDELAGSRSPLARSRASVWARTETNAASNGAAQRLYRAEGIEGNEWLSAPDARPDHLAASGQFRRVGDLFIVGGEQAEYPGDPNLSPAQRANCRCTLLPITGR